MSRGRTGLLVSVPALAAEQAVISSVLGDAARSAVTHPLKV